MMKNWGKILAFILILVLLHAPSASNKDTKNVNPAQQEKAGSKTESTKGAVPVKSEEPKEKDQVESEPPAIAPADVRSLQEKSSADTKPVQPQQLEPLSASDSKEKGRQIKWDILCSGGSCGDNLAKGFVLQEYLILCGSVGQTAVGPGSSPSFGVNSGYWQETFYDFLRGDANGDGMINLTDAIYLLNYLFRDGPPPDPMEAGDANCTDSVNLSDVIYLLNYLFRGGPEPSC